MHKAHLRKVGGSVMLPVPPVILELLHLHAGESVGLSVDHGKLLVNPISDRGNKRYRLDDLHSQCDPLADISKEDENWLNDKPEGGELL